MITNKTLIACFCMTLFFSIASTLSASSIAELENIFIEKDSQLINYELKLDTLYEEQHQFDGFAGFFRRIFRRRQKRDLDNEINQTRVDLEKQYTKLKSIQNQIQQKIFDVALSYENNGQYKKAIKYYLKVQNINDKVKLRIATCYKALQKYDIAISWLMRMRRDDNIRLKIANCHKLAGNMRQAIHWLFEILERFNGNSAEEEALVLIESYDYPQKNQHYPRFYNRLADIYINRADHFYSSNFSKASGSYLKAVNILADYQNKDPRMVSFEILSDYQSKYHRALEILDRQRRAAEQNFEDRVRRARNEVDDAQRAYRRAQHDAERHYDNRYVSAEAQLRRHENRLRDLKSSSNPSQIEIDRLTNLVNDAQRDLDYVRRNRATIIRSYLSSYQHRLDRARNSYDNLLANRTSIIEQAIAPYKHTAERYRRQVDRIKTLHDANF